jgi:glycosyltransferase involved in cell wall biosynthesis
MKLLIYTHSWAPAVGGVETITEALARGLTELQYPSSVEPIEVTLVTQTAAGGLDDSQFPFRVARQPGPLKLFQLIRSVDVVHLAGPVLIPLIIVRILRKPTVVEHHGFQVACPNGQLFIQATQAPCPGYYMAGRWSKCLSCNKPSGFFASLNMLIMTPVRRWLSNYVEFNIMPTAWLSSVVCLRQMTTIHHSVSPASNFVPTASITSPPVFAFQGRLVSTKGISTLLAAAAILQGEGLAFHVKIFGDGPEMASLRAQAAPLGATIEFLGRIPNERVEAELECVSSVVTTSLAGEVFGLVTAENMLRGKLPIVSDIGSLMEVVGNCGLVFTRGDAEALASCMRRVIEHPSIAAEMGAKARARATQLFDEHNMIGRHSALYELTRR